MAIGTDELVALRTHAAEMRTLADCRQSPAGGRRLRAREGIGADSEDPTYVIRREAQLLIDEDDSPIIAGPDVSPPSRRRWRRRPTTHEGQVFVLRPDGYLGYRGDAADHDALTGYLKATFA